MRPHSSIPALRLRPCPGKMIAELQPYSDGNLNRVVANDNTVGVMFGPEVIMVPGVDKECLNLDEVRTPRSDEDRFSDG